MNVVVVGAGVVGLSCAVRLAEAGHAVRVVAREPPLETTSSKAAAFWFPYLVNPPGDVERWAVESFENYRALAAAAGEADGGVTLRDLLVVGAAGPNPVLARCFQALGLEWRPAARDELPADWSVGWTARVPVAAPARYLGSLVRRLERRGGSLGVLPGGVPSLEAAGAGAELVVHCSGLGARTLAGDAAMEAVRGQVVVVRNPGLTQAVLHEGPPPTYVVPRGDECVLGGTEEHGTEDLTPDAATTEWIRARASRLVPAVAGARELAVLVGLRPVRPEVRLEYDPTAASPPVIHCYGHGGAGFTLAWGCAGDVAKLATHPTAAS